MLPLPHRTPPEPASELLFFFDLNNLLPWALWGCGRRARVVHAQRQIHRTYGKAWVIKPSILQIDQHRHGYRRSPRPWGTRRAGGTDAVCPARRRPCRSAAVITTAPLRVLGMLAFHCKSLRNVSQAVAAAPAQAGIIRLRHGAPRRLFPATLVARPRRSPHISLLRWSQRQAPPLGSRRPVAARLVAATL